MSNALELKVLFTAVDKFVRPVKAITAGAKEASQALAQNSAKIKEFDRAVANIDAFKKLERDAAITANAFSANRKKIDELKAAMAAAGGPTKAMAADMERLTRNSADLKAKHESLITAEQGLHQKMKAAGLDTGKLADERRRLASASAEATNASRRLQTALEAENQKMKRLRAAQADLAKSKETAGKLAGTGGKLLAGGAAASAAAAVPVAAYATAEDAQTQLKIAMMQKGGQVSDQFKDIDALATMLGNKLPGTTADFQNMMTMLIRQGMPVKSLLGGLGEATAYLGVQLKMAPDAAAEFASKLQDATRTSDKDMMGLMDTIQKTFYLGVDQSNMLQGFSKLSPVLSVLKKEGLEAANVLAPLLVMADQAGIKGEAAGNAYRKIFQQSLDQGKMAKGNAELKGTGINLDFTDGKGEFGGLDKMYAQLEKLKTVNSVQRLAALKKMFGDDAETLQALTLMIEKGASGYAETQAKMANQANIQERVNAQLGTLKNLWDAASGTFTNALVAFGESIAPELHATAEWMGSLAAKTQAWAKEHPGLAHGIMTVVKYLGMFLLVAGGIALAVGSILGPLAMAKFALTSIGITGAGAGGMLAGAFSKIGMAVATVGKALLMNPIGLTITAIALGAFLIIKYWEPISAFFSGLWNGIAMAVSTGWAGIKGVFGDMLGFFNGIGTAIVDGIWNSLSAGWTALVAKVQGLAALLPEAVKTVLGIHSPSRVFAEIGGHTMAGLEQGLTGSEKGPLGAAAGVAKKLAGIGAGMAIGGAAMAGGLQLDGRQPVSLGASGDSAGGGNTYQITITAAPGTDNAGLAALVGREIERIEANKAARSRSRLRDME